ncbi:hypothetical protein C0992_006958 [Termitomyces sp. T32_za158]|nr:hypothetical protein C0992_006958 [Termitomyces sp. T32_za158]
MATRYSLRSQQPGTSKRRLSPTAIRNTGPLQRANFPGALDDIGMSPLSDVRDTGPHIGIPTSIKTTVMPSESELDAAEPRASVEVSQIKDDEPDTSLSSQLTDVDEHQDRSNNSSIIDTITSLRTPLNRKPYGEEVPEEAEIAFAEARSHLTEEERECIERRMDKVLSFQSTQSTPDPSSREGQLMKGKGIDPRNWGDIPMEESEYDPLIQREILTECNARQERENQMIPPISEANVQANGVADSTAIETRRQNEDQVAEPDEPVVSQEEVLEYLRDKKRYQREMDRKTKREKFASRKRKDRAGSEPLSNELAALIQKVAEGSKRVRKYRAPSVKKTNRSDAM